ncbi:hypothetical protein EV182_005569, partial [Spiromyces aspiralis]
DEKDEEADTSSEVTSPSTSSHKAHLLGRKSPPTRTTMMAIMMPENGLRPQAAADQPQHFATISTASQHLRRPYRAGLSKAKLPAIVPTTSIQSLPSAQYQTQFKANENVLGFSGLPSLDLPAGPVAADGGELSGGHRSRQVMMSRESSMVGRFDPDDEMYTSSSDEGGADAFQAPTHKSGIQVGLMQRQQQRLQKQRQLNQLVLFNNAEHSTLWPRSRRDSSTTITESDPYNMKGSVAQDKGSLSVEPCRMVNATGQEPQQPTYTEGSALSPCDDSRASLEKLMLHTSHPRSITDLGNKVTGGGKGPRTQAMSSTAAATSCVADDNGTILLADSADFARRF